MQSTSGCFISFYECVKKLIEYGANVNHQSPKDLWTPLMGAVQWDKPKFTIVKALLDAGAKVSLKNKHGDTALSYLEPGKRFEDVPRTCVEVLKEYL
jgi:ankyrin repeat protein